MTPPTDNHLPRGNASRRLAAASASGLALLVAGLAPGAAAAAETRVFSLPSEPLEAALVRFAVQGGVSVGGLPARGCDGRSRPVYGSMPPERALAALLPDGCGFQVLDARSFRIVARRQVAEAPPTPTPIRVRPAVPSEGPGLEELVVTAEKRPELLTRSASAVSVLSGRDLQALGGDTFDEVASQMVGVAVTNLGPGRDKIFVRGLSDGSFTGKTQSTVGLYLDDTPITYNAPDPDLRLVDVDRVEVLRGPQGTLYGSGSMGGIVRIVTAKPDVTAFSAEASAQGMLTQHGQPSSGLEGMVNMPLAGGQAAVRAVGYSDEAGGYIDNPVLGLHDVNYSRRLGGRLEALADLQDGWKLEARLAHQSIETADSQYTQGGGGNLTRDAAVREPSENEFNEASLTASHAGGIADLKISSAYIDHVLNSRYDATGAFRAAGGSLFGQAFDEGKHVRMWETEALVSSNAPGPLRWLGGAFLSTSNEADQALLTNVVPPGPPRTIFARNDRLSEAAVYGDLSYDLTSRLSLTLGARAFVTQVAMKADDFQIALQPLGPLRDSLTDKGVAPKLRLAYALPRELVVYGEVQEGYRAGGFNIPAIAAGSTLETAPRSFRPDRLWNYEIGAGLPLLDHRLILRGAIFYADWSGLQTDQRLASGLPITVNIGDGSNYGVEAEAVWRPTGRLQVRANLLLEDPSITRASDAFPARRDIGLPGVPYDMGAADMRYAWKIGHLDAEASAQVAYVGRSYLTFDGGVGNAMGGYTSGRLATVVSGRDWRITAFIDNVTDERGNTFAFGNPFSHARATQATPLRPRTLGLGLSRSF